MTVYVMGKENEPPMFLNTHSHLTTLVSSRQSVGTMPSLVPIIALVPGPPFRCPTPYACAHEAPSETTEEENSLKFFTGKK